MPKSVSAILALTLVVAACGKSPPQPPSPAASGWSCPPPLSWSAAEARPWGVRVHNPGEREVDLWIDGCRIHERLGTVPPGRTRAFQLPARLVPYPAGLRFLVYPERMITLHYATVLPLDTARVLALELPAEQPARCAGSILVDGQPFAGQLKEIPRERIARVDARIGEHAGVEQGERCPVYLVHTTSPEPASMR